MQRKLTAYLLVCAMLAALTACGESQPSGTDTTDGETSSAPVETSEFVPANVKYGGVDFVIAENDVGDWMQSAFITEQNGEVLNDSIYERNRIVEELYDVNIKGYKIDGYRSDQNLSQIKNSVLAGDKEFDIAYIPGQLTSKLFTEPDFLVPLSEIDTIDLSHSWWAQGSVEAMTFFGKTVSATGDMIVSTDGSATVTFFNKTLADQYKIDVYDVVRQGKFTFDWVYQTGQLAQSDLNGDTKIDTADDRFGFIVESLNLIHMISSAGEKLARTNQNGEPELTINSKVIDIAQRYVEVINDTDTVISVQDYRIKSGGPASVFNPGRAFFWITNLQRMNAARSFEVDFGMVPFPKWEESDEYIAPMNGYWDSWLMVPATNDELDRTGNIVEALGYYSKELVTPAFIETSVTTKALRDDESAEMLQMVLPKMSFDAGLYFDWGYSQFIQIATKHTSDVVSLIDSERPAIEASIADFIKAFK